MKKRDWISVVLALTLFAMTMVVSCRHKDIECPSGMQKVYVKFEWTKSPGADVAGMTLFFYPSDAGGRIWRYDIAGREGGFVELPAGHYSMIAFNNDLPGITLENTDSPATLEAAMRRRVYEGVYAASGMLYGTTVTSLEVTPCGVRYSYMGETGDVKECGKGLVRCLPDSVSTLFTVRIGQVSGIERVSSAEVWVEGIRTSVFLKNGCPSEGVGAVAINMDADLSRMDLSGSGCAFAATNLPEACGIVLRVETTDGTRMVRRIPIGLKNLNFLSPHNVLITAEGIGIPEGGGPGDIGGIDVDVEGWEVVNIDVGPTIK